MSELGTCFSTTYIKVISTNRAAPSKLIKWVRENYFLIFQLLVRELKCQCFENLDHRNQFLNLF